MTIERPSNKNTILCPTCGTQASKDAQRCLVCGTDLNKDSSAPKRASSRQRSAVQGSRMPEITLSLPIVLILLALFLFIGGGLVYLGLNSLGTISTPEPSVTPSITPSPTPSPTPQTPTVTHTPLPSPTPFTYVVQTGDTCGEIAAIFGISIQSIIIENRLDASCTLFENMELRVPNATPTPTPLATATLTDLEGTRAACPSERYIVQQNDTLGLIAEIYQVPIDIIMEWNGLTVPTAFLGQTLIIPTCRRTSVGSSTVTPSPAPPYPAAELLLPVDGQAFSLADDTVVLQWSAVGTLRSNEFYQVTVINITGGEFETIVAEVGDTKFTVPSSMRPTDSTPNVFRWYVVPVAQVGVNQDGNPIFVPGGPVSQTRAFTWSGVTPDTTAEPY